jgi:hypothetical protein
MAGFSGDLEREFVSPSDEFSPIPLWFWNDALDEAEIDRQIRDFRAKGIAGFLIHPRMGLPRDIPYLSDRFMALVRHAVETAASLGMVVVLYDEAMYPSGSAHGEVVRLHPEYAAHSLRMAEGRRSGGGSAASPELGPGERITVAFQALAVGEGRIAPGSLVALSPSSDGSWRIPADAPAGIDAPGAIADCERFLFFIETASGGTIRGIHFGEDDGESGAPAAADLLDPAAVAEFLRITYDRYYEVLAPWFGSTVIAMFTDEPDIRGRRCKEGEQPWTPGFLQWFEARGGRPEDLAALWLDVGAGTEEARRRFKDAIGARLGESYYRQLSEWCDSHGIALTGHPAGASDIAMESYFHIPGQDLVWRWVDPDDGSALEGEQSTQARCSSDAARIGGRRRNANECFACCGPKGNPWAFSAADMKWYLDWLFARGVNLILPHAFFYSVEGEERYNERPPDVGPSNIWWEDYAEIAAYIRRMSWLNTDSVELVDIAILSSGDHLPWRSARELYRRQAGFHYLPSSALASELCASAEASAAGGTSMRDYLYRVLLSESALEPEEADPRVIAKIVSHIASGGRVVMSVGSSGPKRRIAGVDYAASPEEAALLAISLSERAAKTLPFEPNLRTLQLRKGDFDFLVLFNEGPGEINTTLITPLRGSVCRWDPWTGEIGKPAAASLDGSIPVRLGYRESLVLRIDPSRAPETRVLEEWRLIGNAAPGEALGYRISVDCGRVEAGDRWLLDCGDVGEIARLNVNGRDAGFRLWKPYRFELSGLLKPGINELVLEVRPSLCAKYGAAGPAAGLLGPARLIRIPAPHETC